ncbi:hypothetical protein TNCV_369611 [Trichonephila clavipes]|nr:hypothetical protein TNCV_369611 [Trichonephila clavipes]
MRRGHLRHIDIQSENCRQLLIPSTLIRRSSIPLNSSQGTLLLHVVRGDCYTWRAREDEGVLDFEEVVVRPLQRGEKNDSESARYGGFRIGEIRDRSESRSTKESDTGSAKYGGVRTGETLREGTDLEAPPTKDL